MPSFIKVSLHLDYRIAFATNSIQVVINFTRLFLAKSEVFYSASLLLAIFMNNCRHFDSGRQVFYYE